MVDLAQKQQVLSFFSSFLRRNYRPDITVMVDLVQNTKFFPSFLPSFLPSLKLPSWYNRHGWLGAKYQVTSFFLYLVPRRAEKGWFETRWKELSTRTPQNVTPPLMFSYRIRNRTGNIYHLCCLEQNCVSVILTIFRHGVDTSHDSSHVLYHPPVMCCIIRQSCAVSSATVPTGSVILTHCPVCYRQSHGPSHVHSSDSCHAK